MVMQFGVNEEFEDAPDVMMCECLGEEDDDGGGVRAAPGKNYTNLPKLGDPPVISCHLLLRLLDDALNMMRSLQYVTIGLVTRLDDMKYKFPFEDLFEKLRWHANCYWEWQEADSSKFLESQQAVVDSARTLCYFFLEFSRLHTEGAGIFRTKVPPSGRKFFLGGNWKCNGTAESVRKLVADLNAAEFADVEDVDVVVFPPLIYIDQVVSSLTERIHVGAQNCWTGKGGAFTGETSAEQLADMGVKWVVVGHTERRHVVGESNAMVARKATYALLQGLGVIIAIGETLAERDQGITFDILYEQLQGLVSKIADWSKVVLAYEPVWAIGTGKACSPGQAQEVHLAIREWMKKNTSEEVATALRIIYGASVSSSTCDELALQPDLDGFFVGDAAWHAAEFAAIANSVKMKKNTDFAEEQMEALGEEPDPKWQEFLEVLLQATTLNKEAIEQLDTQRAQHEADYNTYLDAEIVIIEDGQTSNLQHELLEKRTEEDFKSLEEQEFGIFDAEYSPLTIDNTEMEEKLLDLQNSSRTWELQQRGKNGQSAEEVADLMWVFEHDITSQTEELANLRVENDETGAYLKKMVMYYVHKDQEAARIAHERLQAAYAICDKKRKRWLPSYAASRIQRYWKRYLKKKNGGVEPPKKGKGGKKGGKGRKGKKGKK